MQLPSSEMLLEEYMAILSTRCHSAFPVDAFDDIADPLHAILLLRQRRQGLLQFKALKIQCRVTRNRPIGLSPVT